MTDIYQTLNKYAAMACTCERDLTVTCPLHWDRDMTNQSSGIAEKKDGHEIQTRPFTALPQHENDALHISDYLTKYWATYMSQFNVDGYSKSMIFDDALYGLGAALDNKYKSVAGYDRFKSDLKVWLESESCRK